MAETLPDYVGQGPSRGAGRARGHGSPTESADPIEALLRKAIDNLGSALGTYQTSCTIGEIRLFTDNRELWAALSPLIGAASHEVTVASQELAAFGESRGELYGLLGQLHKRQLKVRLLCPPCTLMPSRVRGQLSDLSRSGVDVRLARRLGCSLLVIDGSYVALGGRQQLSDGEPVPRVIREPGLARIVRELLVRVHAGAGPIEGFLRYEDPDKAELMVAILDTLNRGQKDDSAARALGLSVRTYRRRVADVLSWLNVGSRFEAGVRAAELGLVPTSQDRVHQAR